MPRIIIPLIFMLIFCNTSAFSESKSYSISFTKATNNFNIKNSFPIFLPEKSIEIVNISGSVSSITRKNPSRHPGSELLFGLSFSSTSKCPQNGESSVSYSDLFYKYRPYTLFTGIIKQNFFGKKTFHFSYDFMPKFILNGNKANCLFLTFDGTDFSGIPYTMEAKININYIKNRQSNSVEQKILPLDGEMIVSVNNKLHPTLNGYIVYPVIDNTDLAPGTSIENLNGNTSILGINSNNTNNNTWSIKHIISVYQKNICSKSFLGHINGRFTWNDKTGYGKLLNKSSVFDKNSMIIAESEYRNIGGLSQEKQIKVYNNLLPLKLHKGDCVVDAIIPKGNLSDSFSFNTESQLHMQISNN